MQSWINSGIRLIVLIPYIKLEWLILEYTSLFSTLLLSLNWNKIAWNIKLSDIRNRIISIEFIAWKLMETQLNENKNYRL
jgi:hypothetical protein